MGLLLLGAISLSLLSFQFSSVILYILIACAGAASIGAQIMLLAYMAKFYAPNVRSTGIGWGLGMETCRRNFRANLDWVVIVFATAALL